MNNSKKFTNVESTNSGDLGSQQGVNMEVILFTPPPFFSF